MVSYTQTFPQIILLILLIRFVTDCLRLYFGLINLMDGEAKPSRVTTHFFNFQSALNLEPSQRTLNFFSKCVNTGILTHFETKIENHIFLV